MRRCASTSPWCSHETGEAQGGRDYRRDRWHRSRQERLGGKAIAIPTDVAEYAQIEAAVAQAECEPEPIDIRVNHAVVTMVTPVDDISPEDYRRVTDITHQGFVWSAMAPLKCMRACNCGAADGDYGFSAGGSSMDGIDRASASSTLDVRWLCRAPSSRQPVAAASVICTNQ
jgi:NAD(P)-dependent dehydrogenase (short-subunit alcohol dehydrogenase family)